MRFKVALTCVKDATYWLMDLSQCYVKGTTIMKGMVHCCLKIFSNDLLDSEFVLFINFWTSVMTEYMLKDPSVFNLACRLLC